MSRKHTRSPLPKAVSAIAASNDRRDRRHEIFEERHNHRDLQQHQQQQNRDIIVRGGDRQLFAGSRQLLVDVFYEQQQMRQPSVGRGRGRGRVEDEQEASSPEEEPINENGMYTTELSSFVSLSTLIKRISKVP